MRPITSWTCRRDGCFRADHSDKETWKRYDWEFHLALIRACRSRNLLDIHSIVFDKYLRYQMLVLTYRGEEAVREHRKVFELALARDVKGTRAALEEHITNGLTHTLRHLAGSGQAPRSPISPPGHRPSGRPETFRG